MKKILCVLLLAAVAGLFARELKKDNYAKKGTCSWQAPSYWAGKLSLKDVDGKKCLYLESGVRNKNEFFGRALATNVRGVPYYPGMKIRIKLTAKGTGEFSSGILVYSFSSGVPQYNVGGKVQLTGEFKDYEFTCTLKEQHRMILPYLEIRPQGGNLTVSSFNMESLESKNSLKAENTIQIVESGKKVPAITFRTDLKNTDMVISKKYGTKVEYIKTRSDADGKITYEPGILKDGIWEIAVSADGGAVAKTVVDVRDKTSFAAMDALAKKARNSKKMHVLFLGDSLTDFYRGENYVDRVSFWINKYAPGKFTFRNAGIGGDFLKRMDDRLKGELRNRNWAWRQKDYKGLFKEKYDLIFLFLGHNDTRARRKEGFSKQETPPALQQKCLKSIFEILTKNCPGAKIVLIAPSPSDEALFLARDKKLKKGVNMVMYGKKEFVDLYDAENRKFCKEHNLDYVDVLTAMRNAPVLKDLYVSDGVHLSPAGQRVITAELLRYLCK